MAKKKDKNMVEGVPVDKIAQGLTAEEWEKAYLELQAKVAKREKYAKEIMRLSTQLF